MSPTTAALVLAWACVVVLALATAGLLRRVEALERQAAGLAGDGAGNGAGDAVLATGPRPGLQLPLGRYLGAAGGDRDVLLLIVSPSCGSCRAALADLAGADTGHLDVVVATTAGSLEPLTAPPDASVVTDAGDLVDVLGVPATPYLVRLDADGTVRRAGLATRGAGLAAWTADLRTSR